MIASAQLALQKAIHDLLIASPFQAACGVDVGVYDRVPRGASLPYLVISDIHEDGGQEQFRDASDLHANLAVYSSKPGKVELQTIASAVRKALAPVAAIGQAPVAPFSLDGHRLVSWKHLQTLPFDEPDGVTVKAVVKLLFLTEPL